MSETTNDGSVGEPCEKLIIVLRGEEREVPYEAGDTILQAAFAANLRPPLSCLQGDCATCMAKITEGSATMHANNVLTAKEVEQGYVLTCQGVPTAKRVRIVYEE